MKLDAHETLSAENSAVRVSCPTSIEDGIKNFAGVANPFGSLNNLNLTPLPEFSANLSQFDSTQVIDGPVNDFVPKGMTI